MNRFIVTRRYSQFPFARRTQAERSCALPRTITATGPSFITVFTWASCRNSIFTGSGFKLPLGVIGFSVLAGGGGILVGNNTGLLEFTMSQKVKDTAPMTINKMGIIRGIQVLGHKGDQKE